MVRDLKPFCLRCDAFTEVEDAGDPAHPICSRCRHRDVEFRPITPLRPPPPDPVPTPNGPHERSLLSKKRLCGAQVSHRLLTLDTIRVSGVESVCASCAGSVRLTRGTGLGACASA